MTPTIPLTANPWRVESYPGKHPVCIMGGSGEFIATLPSVDYAYLICHCINMYPVLVEALGALHPFVNQFHCGACRALTLAKKGREL